MAKDNKRRELEERIAKAADADEVKAILAENDVEVSAEEAQDLLKHAQEACRDGAFLSVDELEAVAGGEDRDFLTQGCAATVEPGSKCWGTDGDCWVMNVSYSNLPSVNCPSCGRYSGFFDQQELVEEPHYRMYYHCYICGHKWVTDVQRLFG